MPLYDPYRRRCLAEVDVQTLPPVGVVVPTRGRTAGDPWFAHMPWTGESVRIEDLPESVQGDVRAAIRSNDLRERLLQRCDDVRGLDQVPPMDETEALAVLSEAVEARRAGWADVDLAVSTAKARGFGDSEVALALATLEDEPTLSDALDGVEVVSVSRIAEKMRARTD